jgi:hypothetical protein
MILPDLVEALSDPAFCLEILVCDLLTERERVEITRIVLCRLIECPTRAQNLGYIHELSLDRLLGE